MITEILDSLDKLTTSIQALLKERRELADNALRSISNALDETYFYYRDIDAGSLRNKERELQLSKYWSASAIPIRHMDPELAEKCDRKAEYWVNPDHWDHSRTEELGISLDQVREKYRTLLNKKTKRRPT